MAKITNTEVEAINIIAAGTSIQGDLKTDGDIRLNGTLKGNLETTEKLVIGPMGKVEGDIKCKNADVEGTIIGTIRVTELLFLKRTANVQGDITTTQLSVEPGAIFTGTCKMSNNGEKPKQA
ncbi:MAG: polymer-forming cytoskeletal protein [Bacteroidales bacterium]|nr:polymer-forming cytoskeletal protein [Bacteroidales bacterium]